MKRALWHKDKRFLPDLPGGGASNAANLRERRNPAPVGSGRSSGVHPDERKC